MAIDSSLFGVDLPAGTYTNGDVIKLGNISGPAVVRSGRGAAILKRLTVGQIGSASGSTSYWKIHAKNSDWVDDMISVNSNLRVATMLDERTGCVQSGNNCPLTPNSSWEVWAECVETVTTTVANSLFALIDIDYPSVSSITDPDSLIGIPTSIEYDTAAAITIGALGTLQTSAWYTVNVDLFKAGYEYAMAKLEVVTNSPSAGFVALSNAAGMGGLTRIIPFVDSSGAIRNKIEYATKLVKGPMDIKILPFANSSTASSSIHYLVMDFVKRRVA